MAPGLPVGGFIAIVFVILLLNVGGVFGYHKFLEKNPDKTVAPKLAPELLAPLRWAMVGLIALSWIFSVACTAACTFVDMKYEGTVPNFYGGGVVATPITLEVSFGFQCVSGPNSQGQGGVVGQDSRADAAYAFAVINNLLTTAVLAGIVLVQLNSLGVFRPKVLQDETFAGKVWRAMGFLTLASTWCCLFTFYVQQTLNCVGLKGYSCSLGGAGIAQAFNAIFLIGICFLFFVVPSPPVSGGGGGADATGDDDGDKKKEAADGGDEEDPTEAPEASTAKDDVEGDDDGEKATPAKDSEDSSL